MNRIALISSSFVSFLSFANPEKGVPNSGISILLSYLFWLSPNGGLHRRGGYHPNLQIARE
jgi:hypothetical protein